MNIRQLPNIITLLRFILIFPIVIALLSNKYELAFYLFLAAAISDGVDGFLARCFRWTSRFGSIADPLSDKLLMLGCFAALAWLGYVPVWVWALVFARDLVISFGALYYQFCVERLAFRPSFISKTNTVAQLFVIGLWLLHLGAKPVPVTLISLFTAVMIITTVVSFVNYVWVWAARAWQKKREIVV